MGKILGIVFIAAITWAAFRNRPKFGAVVSAPHVVDLSTVAGIDRAAWARWTDALVALGFKALPTFELPHFQSKLATVYFASFTSEDQRCVGTLNFRLQAGMCILHVTFDTWFDDDKHVETTNTHDPDLALDPDTIRVPRIGEWDLGKLLAAHRHRVAALEAEGRTFVPIDSLETLGAILCRFLEHESSQAIRRGLLRHVGDYVVGTSALSLRGLLAMLHPLVPGCSAKWHAGIGALVVLASVSAAFGAPFLSGVGLGLTLGLMMGIHGTLWGLAATVAAALLRAPGSDVDLLLNGFFLSFQIATLLRIGAGNSRVTRWLLWPTFRLAALASAGLIAATCASKAVIVALSTEVHVLPANYRGPVAIQYGSPDGTTARKTRFRVEYQVPPSGMLAVRDSFPSTNRELRRFSFYLGSEKSSAPVLPEWPRREFRPMEIRVCHLQISYAANKTWLGYFVGDESTCRNARPAIQEQIDRATARRAD